MTRGYYHNMGGVYNGANGTPDAYGLAPVLVGQASGAGHVLKRTLVSGGLWIAIQASSGPSAPAPAFWSTVRIEVALWCDKGVAGSPAGVGPFSNPSVPPVWQASLSPTPISTDPYNAEWSVVRFPIEGGRVAVSEAQRKGRTNVGDHAPKVFFSWFATQNEGPPFLGFAGGVLPQVFLGVGVSTDTVWFSPS